MTLQTFLHQSGLAARRKVNAFIENGQVEVNGQIVREFWFQIDPDRDVVNVAGKRFVLAEKFEYFLFHKPSGLITTAEDPQNRLTVLDYVRYTHGIRTVIHTVGRLDKDTEGLIILTNDGRFTHSVAHPSLEIPKTYFVVLSEEITQKERERIENGIMIEGVRTAPAKLDKARQKPYGYQQNPCWYIIIHEGKKRQVRKMFENVGRRVVYLRRERIGSFSLEGIEKPGSIRRITEAELSVFRDTYLKQE
jgi:pseudouridine synthase